MRPLVFFKNYSPLFFERVVFSYGLTVFAYYMYANICVFESQNPSGSIIPWFNNDLLLYSVGIILFFVFFLLSLYLSRIFNGYLKIINCVFIPILFLSFFLLRYKYEPIESLWFTSLIRHNGIGRMLFIVVVICVFLLFTIDNPDIVMKSNNVRHLLCFMISISFFFVMFYPNYLGDSRGGVVDFSAYVTSIIATSDFQPYSDLQYSIYGHYGIIYMPIVNLVKSIFHINQLLAIQVSIAFFSALTILSTTYLANKLIKNNFVFSICCISIPLMYTMLNLNGYYYQLIPNRILFPSFFCAFILWINKRNSIHKRYKAVLIVFILSLAYIWNIESALVCSVGFIGWLVANDIYQANNDCFVCIRQNGFFKIVLSFSIGLMICIVSAIIGIITVNIYNVTNGGRINTFFEILYPFGSNSYSVFSFLNSPICTPASIWFAEAAVFCIILSYSLLWIAGEKNEKYPIMLMMALCGAGLLVVFINRSYVYNAILPYPFYVIFLGVIADSCSCNIQHVKVHDWNVKYIIGIIIRTCLFINSITFFLYLGMSLESRINNGWRESALDDYTDYISSIYVENNTTSIGWTVPLAMSRLGIKPTMYTVDLGDMSVNEKAMSALRDNINCYEYIITDNDVIDRGIYNELLNGYQPIDTQEFENGIEIFLYKKHHLPGGE